MQQLISPELIDRLQRSWVALFERLGIEPARIYPAFDDLVVRYGEEHRHYHNLEHIAEVLKVAGKLADSAKCFDAIVLAIWFHDAIYDTHAKNNEDRSAQLASGALNSLGLAAELVEKTATLILATAHSGVQTNDVDTHILLDADLAILAADERRYQRYAEAIRHEYAWVDDAAYRAGRKQVLRSFQNRPRIFQTARMFELGEAAARNNIAKEIERLTR